MEFLISNSHKKIKALDLSLTPSLGSSRNILIISFILRNTSFIDMAYLKNDHILKSL